MNTQKGFAPILLILLGLVVISGGGYLYLNNKSSIDIPTEKENTSVVEVKNTNNTQVTVPVEKTIDKVIPKVVMDNIVTTAYLFSIEGDKITLDYIEILYGEDAEKAAIKDGICEPEEINNGCFPNGPTYDRNINPKLRTFELAKEVKISTAYPVGPEKAKNISIDTLKYYYISKDENGLPYSPPFNITIKDNVVTSIVEIYRP